jgi:hypothetical protein
MIGTNWSLAFPKVGVSFFCPLRRKALGPATLRNPEQINVPNVNKEKKNVLIHAETTPNSDNTIKDQFWMDGYLYRRTPLLWIHFTRILSWTAKRPTTLKMRKRHHTSQQIFPSAAIPYRRRSNMAVGVASHSKIFRPDWLLSLKNVW